jgi:hypothetical protein
MNNNMTLVFKDNLKAYKALNKKIEQKVEITLADKNTSNALFYIIAKMHQRYGCINCFQQKCSCNLMPSPNKLVTKKIIKESNW